MADIIREPTHLARAARLTLFVLAATAAWGCELVIGDIPENPVAPFDAGTEAPDFNPVAEGGGSENGSAQGEGPDASDGSADRSTTDGHADGSHGNDAIQPDDGAFSGDRDAPHDQSVPVDAPTDNSAPRDVTQDPSVDADPCDKDGDGYRSNTASCGGTDCDDSNPDVHPNQSDYSDQPTHLGGTNFDYDCSGQPVPQYDSVDCSALLGLGCPAGVNKFLGATAPACGQPGNFGHCKKNTLSCDPEPVVIGMKMPCK